MNARRTRAGLSLTAVVALAAIAACSSPGSGTSSSPAGDGDKPGPVSPGQVAAPLVRRGPDAVQLSRAESSIALRDLPDARLSARHAEDDAKDEAEREGGHEVRRIPRYAARGVTRGVDLARQPDGPISSMPAAIHNFSGQGNATSNTTVTGDPPDTNGAVGANHFVQTVNGGIQIWDKSGNVVQASKLLNTLWTGYTGTNAGNACATQNDGDPVVVYDQLADRWFVTQFSLPNSGTDTGPSFQCVAVSKTGDPAGAYWLYDFTYPAAVNDYGKFSIWPDGYYATFNLFGASSYIAGDLCVYDRVSMLAGSPATQQCFQNANAYGVQPGNVDGPIAPPVGEPGYFLQLDADANGNFTNKLDLWTLHVDWKTPANSKLTGPTQIPVTAFTPTCGGGNSSGTCVPQGTAGSQLDSLDDRLMFRLSYRNFGTYESLVVNHSVLAGSVGGVRWYEIRSPATAPVIYQQGTYAPADSTWRWMGSIAKDQAEDMALGFSMSSTAKDPYIGWTGRLASDALGTMGQGESTLDSGAATESGASRWGDYSNMTVDPADDCTFWYTQELYNTSGGATWDTFIANVKFPNCAANDFTIALAPAAKNLGIGATNTFTVTTTSAHGTAETIALAIQDLPTGVTGAFNPATVSAGSPSTLTLTAAASAPAAASTTFTVIGKAPSAVHAAKAAVTVTTCMPLTTCPSPDNCGTMPDGCGGTLTCSPGCTAPQTCGGGGTPNVCGCMGAMTCPAGMTCGTAPDGCGGMVTCGTCGAGQSCVNNACVAGPPAADAGPGGSNDGGVAAHDAGHAAGDSGSTGNGDTAGNGGSCGCRTAGAPAAPSQGAIAFAVLGLAVALRSRRRRG
jgi:MYXO-CTERM domain-containing protein